MPKPKPELGKYPNSGALFRNLKRENEKSPEFRGDGEVTCPHCSGIFRFSIAGWVKEWANDKGAGKFFSFRFKPER